MKLLIETYISIFITTICIVTCASFINAEMQMNEARDFHASCIALIESTDFDAETIKNCQDKAIERGYYYYECLNCNTTYEKTATECPHCHTKRTATSAKKKTYLTITDMDNSEKLRCSDCGRVYDYDLDACPNCGANKPVSYLQHRLCTVELKYDIKINILNIKRTGVISGYAR